MQDLHKLYLRYKSNSFLRFIAYALLLYGLWAFTFQYWGIEGFDDRMTELVGKTSAYFAEYIGYEAQHFTRWSKSSAPGDVDVRSERATLIYYLYLNGTESIHIGNGCNGLRMIALYIGFILAYPGKKRAKALYILGGSAIIFFSNVLRILALAVNWEIHRASFEINHKYTYVILVYSIVFVLWMRWVNKHSVTAKKSLTP